MNRILITIFFTFLSVTIFAQGGGIELIKNYGGNGGANEQRVTMKAGDQKYYTVFQRTPIDTSKKWLFQNFNFAVAKDTIGLKKNFRSKTIDSNEIFTASDLKLQDSFTYLQDSLKTLPSQFGFVGNQAVNYDCKITDIDIKFNGKIKNIKQLVLKVKIQWTINNRTFEKTGYYINVSNLKKEKINLIDSFYEAIIGAFDKLVVDEDFRKYLSSI